MFHVKHCIFSEKTRTINAGDILTIYTTDKILYIALKNRINNENCRVMQKNSVDADIAVGGSAKLKLSHNAEILLVNSEKLPKIGGTGKVSRLVSCGMSEKDTVNFSSIDGERAILCVQRGINCGDVQLESGEYPVKYNTNLSIYNNIVLSVCEKLTCVQRKEFT